MSGPIDWLVTGATGQLGTDLQVVLAAAGEQHATALGRTQLDLTDEGQVRSVVGAWRDRALARGRRPVLLNAAAYTAVDAAESDRATADLVNGQAPGWLAEELAGDRTEGRGRLVHVSTDYVFSGQAPLGPDGAPRAWRPDDPTEPVSVYGATKLAGESAVLSTGTDAVVVRTAWVYAAHGANFVRTMLKLEAERETISVVDDQTGNPTWSLDLARGLVDAARADVTGVVHATGTGATTWHGLASAVFELTGADPARVYPTTSADFVRPAPRPAWSVLDGTAWTDTGLAPLPHWRASLASCLAALRGQARETGGVVARSWA